MKWEERIRLQRIVPLTLMLVCNLLQSSRAQHSDVFISVDDNRIVVQQPFHADSIRNFDVLGNGTVWHGTNPGYSTTGPDQFALNDEVYFDVASPLLHSNGEAWDLVDDDSYLRQFWSAFADLSVTADATTESQPGFLIGAVGHRGTVHQHHTFELATYSGEAPRNGAYAIQQVVVADGYRGSDPFWIVLNNGMLITEFATTLRNLPQIGVSGDYDRNGILDIRDVNRLHAKILLNAELSEFTFDYDLTNDDRIDAADLDSWIRELGSTWIGDANLDGEFNSNDLIQVFGFGHYDDLTPDNSDWDHGDWNADGEFNSGDLVMAFEHGGYEQGRRSVDATPVPEPSSTAQYAIVLTICCLVKRKIKLRRLPQGRFFPE